MPPSIFEYSNKENSAEIFITVDLKRSPNISYSRADNNDEDHFETAINYAGCGKFQAILLAVSGIIYATCAISTTTLSFVLPSAQCDFNLTSINKGRLSAVPLIGMLFGCTLWGSLANSKGRKFAIMMSLLMDFLSGIISSLVNRYEFFLICRFMGGFGIIGATSLVFSYLGEFLSLRNRDKYLGKLEIFWNIGIIILPGVGWCFLNKKAVNIFEDGVDFSPWRIFVLVCSLPSLISVILLYFLPETPKYLVSKGRLHEAHLVFEKISFYNYGNYHECPNYYFHDTTSEEIINNGINTKKDSKSMKQRWNESIKGLLENIKYLINNQYLKYLTITCLADFGLMASYFTLIMWFPEIFERFNEYKEKLPEASISVCLVSQRNSTNNIQSYNNKTCNPTIADSVFLETLIIGLSCIPTSVSLSYFMYKIGKKSVLVISLILAGISTISLNWVTTVGQTLTLSCIFEALTSILEAVLFCVVVDLFPTNLRALALATTATCGRLGAIFGNLIFGALVDLNCIIPIYLFGFLLIASGILCLAIPKNEGYSTIH